MKWNKIDWKQKLKSRAVWTSIIMGVIGIADAFGVPIPKEIYGILGAFGIYTARVKKQDF